MAESTTTPRGAGSELPGVSQFTEFLELTTQAHELHRSGQSEQALELARRAETIGARLDPPQNLEAAWAFNWLGVVLFESGYNRAALAAYERSLAIAGRLEPPEEDLLASLYNNLGQAYQRLGQLAKAQSQLENAVALRRRISPDSLVLGFTLDNLASVLGARGNLDAAQKMHEEALEIFERKGGPFDTHVATALGNLSHIHHRWRDFERAEALRLRALDAHERLSGLTNSETLLDIATLADLYRDKGDDASADTLMNLLLSIGGEKPARTHRVVAEMLRSLASTAFRDFRLDLSERLGTRAVELLEAIEGPNAPETLQALRLLGNVHYAIGHVDAAEKAYHRARTGYESLQKRDEAIAVMIDLGKLYRDAGSYPLAEQLFQAAVDHLRSTPERDSQGIASALGNLGLVHYEAERYEKAELAFAEALSEVQRDTSLYGQRPWLLHNLAMLKYHLGEYDAAHQFYEQAKRLWIEEQGEDHPFVATVAANLALLHWAKGDTASALTAFMEAEVLRDREMQRILAVGSEKQRAAYARDDIQGDLHKVVSFCLALDPRPAEVTRFAAQMLLRRKGRVLDAIAHTLIQLRESVQPEDQVFVNRLQTVRQDIAALMAPVLVTRRPTEQRERLAELRNEEEHLEAALSHRGALYRPGLEPITLAEIQGSLPPDGALIELLRWRVFDPVRTGEKGPWKEARYAAVVLRPVGEVRWFDLGHAAPIDVHVDQWRSLLRNGSSEEHKRHALAAELYKLLVEPLRDAISGAHHLLVAPDGKLALIPFGELRNAEGHTLSAQIVVSYVSSGRELKRVHTVVAGAQGVVVIAAPDYEAETASAPVTASSRFADRGRFAPLPGTKDEGEEIGRLLGDVRLFIGRQATVEALRNVRRPVVLHIATHGIFKELEDEDVSQRLDMMSIGDGILMVRHVAKTSLANPMFFSGLALTGANHPGAGILTAQEIAGLDLRGTELVVLSACETGLGTVKQGEEFMGLRRALAIAGAATQVTSLWKVSDTATRVLMGHYYRFLLDGHGRAEALQMAQSRVAQDPAHPEWKHPAYWAAFISAGAWGPMHSRLPQRTDAVSESL
jgi:CHAT domain-containing protein/tetratricopeptide (TPR) repeat protein